MHPQLFNPVVVEVMTEPSYKTMLSAYEKGELPAVQQDCFISPRPEEELFNTIKDIHCLKNIANKKSMKKIKEKFNLVMETCQMSIVDIFDENKLKQDTSDRITGKSLKP